MNDTTPNSTEQVFAEAAALNRALDAVGRLHRDESLALNEPEELDGTRLNGWEVFIRNSQTGAMTPYATGDGNRLGDTDAEAVRYLRALTGAVRDLQETVVAKAKTFVRTALGVRDGSRDPHGKSLILRLVKDQDGQKVWDFDQPKVSKYPFEAMASMGVWNGSTFGVWDDVPNSLKAALERARRVSADRAFVYSDVVEFSQINASLVADV